MGKTQVQLAVEGQVTPLMEEIACKEGVSTQLIRENFAQGKSFVRTILTDLVAM